MATNSEHREDITPEKVQNVLAEIAFDADIAAFEPWVKGEKTLAELKADGVNTQLVETISATGKERAVTLFSRTAAARELVRLLGLAREGRQVEGVISVDATGQIDPEWDGVFR